MYYGTLEPKQKTLSEIVSVEDTRIDAAVAIEFKDAMRAANRRRAGYRWSLDLSQVQFH